MTQIKTAAAVIIAQHLGYQGTPPTSRNYVPLRGGRQGGVGGGGGGEQGGAQEGQRGI